MNSKLNGDFQSRAKKKCLELWRMKNQASQSLPNFVHQYATQTFSNFSCRFLNLNSYLQLNSNCSNMLDMRKLQEKV